MSDIHGFDPASFAAMTPVAEAPRMAPGDDAAKAAEQFEAFLVSFLATQMRSTVKNGPFSSGPTAMFADLLDQELGKRVAEGGGLGMRDTIERSLRDLPQPLRGVAPNATDRNAARTTSGFGVRADPIDGARRNHAGVDLAAPTGTPIHAVKDGVVRYAGSRGGYGNIVILDHGDGTETRYAHCDAVGVKDGQRVAAGEPIATVGSTGRSTGPHLHFEFRNRGAPVDPSALLSGDRPGVAAPLPRAGDRVLR